MVGAASQHGHNSKLISLDCWLSTPLPATDLWVTAGCHHPQILQRMKLWSCNTGYLVLEWFVMAVSCRLSGGSSSMKALVVQSAIPANTECSTDVSTGQEVCRGHEVGMRWAWGDAEAQGDQEAR